MIGWSVPRMCSGRCLLGFHVCLLVVSARFPLISSCYTSISSNMGIIYVRQVCKKCAVSSIVSDECYREMDNENELAEAARDWGDPARPVDHGVLTIRE